MSACWTLAFSVLLTVGDGGVFAKLHLPPYVKLCKRSDPHLAQCIAENFEIFRPHLAKGVPEMKMPGVDPLFVEKVSLDTNNFHLAFLNSTVHEATNFVLKNVTVDLDKNIMELSMDFPLIRLQGNYEVSGNILILELKSAGFSSANISDLVAVAEMRGIRENRKGKTYMNLNNNKLKLKVGAMKLHFSNLFANNEELTERTNQIINDNSQEFAKELLPLLEETVATFVFSIAGDVFKRFSLEELFPAD